MYQRRSARISSVSTTTTNSRGILAATRRSGSSGHASTDPACGRTFAATWKAVGPAPRPKRHAPWPGAASNRASPTTPETWWHWT
jgi:hypothetical protein